MRVVSYPAWVVIVSRNKGVALQQQPVKPNINCAPVTASNYIHPGRNLISSIFLYVIYSSI